MLISEDYRKLNQQLHVDRADYGKSSPRWAEIVMGLCVTLRTNDVLDYGCGKAELNLHLPFSIHNYDPAIERYADDPSPADIVVCTDVMEHVEPEHLDNVLDDLQRVTKKILLLNVATRPAVKTLADGRNAHLIVEPYSWWESKITERFNVLEANIVQGEFTVTLERKSNGGQPN